MIDFATLQGISIPEGVVSKIEDANGRLLWRAYAFGYVSLGDSIAAGHTIDEQWATNYGEGSQYGVNGNKSTQIVPNSYTDLIRNELVSTHGKGRVLARSFARSGDTVADLQDKLSHDVVRNAIKRANLVTICIGANDVLQPAMSHLEEYITTGDLSAIAATVESNLAILDTDSNERSYVSLFNKLAKINPSAKYVFTTVYNPYKYLWIEEGHHGFFKPILDTIPEMTIMGFRVDSLIKDSLLGTSIVKQLFDRVNGLDEWSEKYVTMLNNVLKRKVSAYQSTNSNFAVADTKALFDGVPDRPISAEKHYNDLVSVEFTRGYDVAKMDYGRLWEGSSQAAFWWDLATRYTSMSGLDINGLASELVDRLIEKVITPDVDPHPESYGHYALKRSFADVLGWQALDRYTISFNANGGSGTMLTQTLLGIDGLAAYANINANRFAPATGYYFTGWSDSYGLTYTDGQLIGLTSNLTLNAQWSNMYAVRYRHSNNTGGLYDNNNTGPQDDYELRIGGPDQEIKRKLGSFADDDGEIYYVPYGTMVKVMVTYKDGGVGYKSHNGRIYFNGEKIVDASRANYEFYVTANTDIRFDWVIAGSLVTFNAQSWWDCYITTA